MEYDVELSAHPSTELPSSSRMYDYFLGGHHNFEIDRQAAAKVAQIYPDVFVAAQANRALLRRVVTFLAEQGIDQFLDIGSGIPTVGNVHQVVLQMNPAAHTVYVDIDPVAVAHSRTLLRDEPRATIIHADVRRIEWILRHPEVHRLLDFTRPVAVLVLAIFQFVPDDAEVQHIVRTIRETIPPGSYVAISHGTSEGAPPAIIEQVEQLYQGIASPIKFRSEAEIRALFAGLTLVEPGVVYGPLWRPEEADDIFIDEPARSFIIGGIGQKV